MNTIEYYFNEVFKLKNGCWEFGPFEDADTNAYSYQGDKELIKALTSKLGGEYKYIETTEVHHGDFDEMVHTVIFYDEKEKAYIGVYTFNKAAKA